MPLNPADRLEMQEIVASGVQAGLSRIGLGADSEVEVTALRADQSWTRAKRLSSEDIARMFREGVVRLGLIGVAAMLLYVLTHPEGFAAFLMRVISSGNTPK